MLARKMYSSLPTEWLEAMAANRLLIISTAPNAVRVSKAAADARNRYIVEYSDEIVFGSIQPNSSLNQVYKDYIEKANILFEKLE